MSWRRFRSPPTSLSLLLKDYKSISAGQFRLRVLQTNLNCRLVMDRSGYVFGDEHHFLITLTNVFERSSKSVNLHPALMQIQKTEMTVQIVCC